MARMMQLIVLLAGVVICAVGCTGQTEARKPGQVIYLDKVEYSEAFAASVQSVREQFVIAKEDPGAGEILSRPAHYTSGEPSGRFNTGLTGATDQLRHRASVLVMERTEGLAVDVRVDIERRDTDDYRVFEGIQASQDLRMRTPAEQRAVAGSEQREVWSFVRRDNQSEEQLIRGIKERLGLLQAGGPGGTQSP